MPPKTDKIVLVKDPNSDQVKIRLVPQQPKKAKNKKGCKLARRTVKISGNNSDVQTSGTPHQFPEKLSSHEMDETLGSGTSQPTFSKCNHDEMQLPSSSRSPSKPLSDELVGQWNKVLVQKIGDLNRLNDVEMTLDDLDSPDSAYMRLSKKKKQLVQHVRNIYKISGDKYLLDRRVEKKIYLQNDSPFSKLSAEVERYVNTLKDVQQQPTRDDICKVVKEANEKADPKYTNSEVELNEIITRFHQRIVNTIKTRRLEDFSKDLSGYITTSQNLDGIILPEDNDPELKAKFDKIYAERECPSMEQIQVRERQENDTIDESEEIGGEGQETDDDDEYESETDEDIADEPLTREAMDEGESNSPDDIEGRDDEDDGEAVDLAEDGERLECEVCEVESGESEKENSENGLENPCIDDVECLDDNDEVQFVSKTKRDAKFQNTDDGGSDSDCQIID